MDIDDPDKEQSQEETSLKAGELESSPKADEAALELMKQLITLASGVLALSAAFVDKLPKAPQYLLSLLFLSWVL